MAKLTEIGWKEFEALPLEAKRPYLERPGGEGMPYHTLFAQQFDRPLLERLAALANRIRFISKSREGALFLKSFQFFFFEFCKAILQDSFPRIIDHFIIKE